jgi:hypothetical protein
MRQWPKFLLTGLILIFLGTTTHSALAKTAGFCLECHSQKNGPPVLEEDRSVYQTKLHPCPGVRTLAEETFFTESRIFKLYQILQEIEREDWASGNLRRKLSETTESLLDLQTQEKNSYHQFNRETASLRANLQKIYDHTLKARNEVDRRWLVGVGGLILLGLIALLGVGYHKLRQMGKTLILFYLVGASLTLFSCSIGPAGPEKKSPAQERLEQALSVAGRSLNQMEETFFLSSLLAEMAEEWTKIESGPPEKAFQLAWKMAITAKEKSNQTKDLWNLVPARMEHEEAVKRRVDLDTVLDLSDELRSVEGRTWGLRAVAERWSQVNKEKGRIALEFASIEAMRMRDAEFRDRDLKSIAEAWTGIDENRALEISHSISDPFLKTLALTDVAISTRDKNRARNLLQEALKIAESIPPSHTQAKAFIQISAAATRINPQEKKAWAQWTFSQIQKLVNPQLLALATQELVFKWALLDSEQSERWANGIPLVSPEARAYSFIHLAKVNLKISKKKAEEFLKRALAETSHVSDPYEGEKIKSLIGQCLVEIQPIEALQMVPKIKDPFYRSQILGQMALKFSPQDKRKGLDLAEKIPLENIRHRRIIDVLNQWIPREIKKVVSLYQEALQSSLLIQDPFIRSSTLIELAKNWGKWDRGKEALLLDLTSRSLEEISSPSKKAEILEALAEAWKNLDKARAKKILEEMDLTLIQARRRLEEIRLWSKIDPKKAKQWAEALPSLFSLERALALKEVAAGFKKDEPALAYSIIEKALMEALSMSPGNKRSKLLSNIIVEAALLDKEKTLQRLLEIDDLETKNFLLLEAGKALSKVDPLWAMKAVSEISESAIRCTLYRKISEDLRTSLPLHKSNQTSSSPLVALYYLGLAREKAKSNESQANSIYEKVVKEIEKVVNPLEKSYLLCSLTAEWAGSDEEKALIVAERISSHYPEPSSYALLQVGIQLKKWNRKEAETIFQKVYGLAMKIPDPHLRTKRLLQLANHWQFLNKAKGEKIFTQAKREVRENLSFPSPGEKVFAEILMAQAQWEPEEAITLVRPIVQPSLRAKILLESTKFLSKRELEEDVKILNKSLEFAQTSKNSHLLSEIAVVWFSLDPKKGLELISQVESKEMRIKALRKMAHQSGIRKKETERLFQQATEEALQIDDLKEKVRALKEIAKDWLAIDKEQAKAIYRQIFQTVEKATL